MAIKRIKDHYLYTTWYAMVRRCNNSNDISYHLYGAKGIKVCDRWLEWRKGFRNFLDDMGDRPEGTTLDRIDSNGDYGPENCRWADKITQANNTSRNRFFTIKGETKTLAEWSRDTDIKGSTVRQRFYGLGWPIEKALGLGEYIEH